MSSCHHTKVVCPRGHVLRQCRCMAPKQMTVSHGEVCYRCQAERMNALPEPKAKP